MRVYALALGVLITLGYGCLAQVAVQSSRREPATGASRDGTAPAVARLQPLWCGGTIAPITVEAHGIARPGVMVTGLERPDAAAPCGDAARPRDRAT